MNEALPTPIAKPDDRPWSSVPLVMLTGAAGWLGLRVAAALRRAGYRGRLRTWLAPTERSDALLALDCETFAGDLRDPIARRRFVDGAEGALLIHLAGVIHPPGRTAAFDEVNHRAALDLIDVASQARIARAVVMSSNSPLGANAGPNERFDEDSPYRPYMGYGRSKWRLELGLRERIAGARHPEIVIVRAPWFYGPGQPPRQTRFFSMVRAGRFPVLGSGEQRRSMSYVDTLAHGLLRASVSPTAAGRIWWMADERPYSMNEIVTTVAAVLREDFGLSVAARPLRAPGFIADVARLADASLQALGLYQQSIHVLSEMNLTIACDVSRARREIGFEPLVELREGMRRSVAWCLENGHEL